MGEVYRARDTLLQRDVAIKILPDAFAADADRLARFRREAQALAALNHPNIAAIYGMEEHGGVHALILELVEGQTLAVWIALGAMERTGAGSTLTVVNAVAIARQVADALDAAHERGVVHRDLKPANIKIAPDGRVKILDFGLAKLHSAVSSASEAPSPTVTSGVVLGTAPYMSPEQARGKAVDRRTDVWAFGCLLYELLTGRQAFPAGETATDTLVRVVASDPDWTALPAATPFSVRRLLERCLRKDARNRLRDIGDALLELEEQPELAPPPISAVVVRRRPAVLTAAAFVVPAVLAGALVAWWRAPAIDTRPVAFSVEAPERGALDVGEPLSPDGRKLAFVASVGDGEPVIWIRRVDALAPQALAGTEGATYVFWSPDSQHVGFVADGRLKRVPVTGGGVQVICTACDRQGFQGVSWGAMGVILIGTRGPLLQVAASGGEPQPATQLDTAAGDQWHTGPAFLPDGRQFIFNVRSGGFANEQAYVASLDAPDRRALEGIRSPARYAPSGHLLFRSGTALMAQRFDVDTLTLSGDAVEVAERAAGGNTALFSAAADGTLAYLALADTDTELRWYDRAGTDLGLAGPKGSYLNPELSPDDLRVAVDRNIDGNVDIYLLDLTTGIVSRVTRDNAADFNPIWFGDGRALGFTSYRGGLGRVYRREVDVVAADALVIETAVEQRAFDWSDDGRYLVYVQEQPATASATEGEDLWAVPLDTDSGVPVRITYDAANEAGARVSPDVRWIAYESNESGRPEIYVQSFPDPGAKRQVSAGGGRTPRWKHDGTELYYLTPDGTVMAVSVSPSGDGVRYGAPARLFDADVAFTGLGDVLSVARDGRFLLNVVPADRAPPAIVVLQDWLASFER
jgi:Tol biopolymer transport system component